MLREELETSLQQALELFVLGGGDQRLFERPINGLMVGHLVLGVSLVEGISAQLRQLCRFLDAAAARDLPQTLKNAAMNKSSAPGAIP
jgi:hypothetical protein